jgi:hypothetical protein
MYDKLTVVKGVLLMIVAGACLFLVPVSSKLPLTVGSANAAGPKSLSQGYYSRFFKRDRTYQLALRRIVSSAQFEFRKQVKETNGDNVPRYPDGRIAPYALSPADSWCVAFAVTPLLYIADEGPRGRYTSGIGSFQKAHPAITYRMNIDISGSPTMVPVRVADMWNWAKQTGRATKYAWPGTLVVYKSDHIGIVTRIDRLGKAVSSIEGNKDDRLASVRVNQRDVLGYIRP